MKILHTADWHLGKYLKSFSLLEEQKYVLEELKNIIQQEKPDVVLLAGDIYDRSVPPAEAIELFDKTIEQIVLDWQTPIIAIAGNHDSIERIDYFNNILNRQGFYIIGGLTLPIQPVVLTDEFGEVYFYPIPYTEPKYWQYIYEQQTDKKLNINSHEETMKMIIEEIFKTHPKDKRAVFIGHLFVQGGQESESERQLTVGGASVVDYRLFEQFHYTALGHLHAPQKFSIGKVQYSGSLLKYSASEANHKKGFFLIELGKEEVEHVSFIPLIPQKDLWVVEGKIENREFYLKDNSIQPKQEDFLEIRLQNEEVIPNAMQIIQQKFPNTLGIRWQKRESLNTSQTQLNISDLEKMSDIDLFQSFYQNLKGEEMKNEEVKVLQQSIKEIQVE